jgi:transglutaminase-like putative cysteine protease
MIFSPQKFNIRYQANFNSPDKNIIRIWLVQPLNSITQKIESFSILPKPQKYYKDIQGNKILYFEFKDQKNFNIKMDIKVTLWKNKINLIKEKFLLPPTSSKLFQQYTKNEKFLEQTPAVKKLTHQITNKNQTILDNIFLIIQFLKRNFKYVYPVKKRGVENLNLNNLKGDCGEVGALFATMCRISGIPAINRTGYIIYYNKLNNIYEHGWVSIYLKPYGWIDVDPRGDNFLKKGRNKYLYYQKNYFLSFTSGFNLKIKPKIPSNFLFNYWNEKGLPITNTSVQILQPLVFASLKEIKFSDNIKLFSN